MVILAMATGEEVVRSSVKHQGHTQCSHHELEAGDWALSRYLMSLSARSRAIQALMLETP